MKYISTFAHTEICAALWRCGLGIVGGGAAANMRPSRCLEQALSIWGMLQTSGKNAERKIRKKKIWVKLKLAAAKICHDTNTRCMTQRGGKVYLGRRTGLEWNPKSKSELRWKLCAPLWLAGEAGGAIAFQGHSGQMENYLLPVIILPSAAWLSLSACRADVRKPVQGPTDCYYLFNSTHFLYFILSIHTLPKSEDLSD